MSTHWNYRLVRHLHADGTAWFGVHEVFYENGEPCLWTAEAIRLEGDTVAEIKAGLDHVRRSLDLPLLAEVEGDPPKLVVYNSGPL